MNPPSTSDAMYSNESRAKGHWHNILYALSILGDNISSQEVTDEVNKNVKIKVEQENDPNLPQNRAMSQKQLAEKKDYELEFRKLSRKTTDKLLNRMVKKGLVKKKHHVYSLTPEGHNEKIFGEYYGRFLYDKLMEMPLKGSVGERLEEYVKRVGIYITYIFMRNSNRAGIQHQYSTVRSDYDEWVNDSISPVVLLEWFNNTFYSKSDSNNYDKLTKVLNSRFNDYINNLEDSEKMYFEKVFPFLHKTSVSMLEKREEKRLDFKY